jgi:AcrR family transcriptional regulator
MMGLEAGQIAPVVGSRDDPRDRILRVAARLFSEKGYRSTTVRDIAREVGILSGSLFHHFRTKEEMLLDIMRDAAVSVCEHAEAIIEQPRAPALQLRELIRQEIDSITDDSRRHFHAVLFFEWREVPRSARPEFGRLRKRYQRSWLSVLEKCHAAGLLRCEPQAASLILHGALRNAMVWFSPGGRYSAEQFGDILAGLIMN